MTVHSKAVIFDLDGTLLDTLADLATSGNEVLTNRGLPTHSTEDYCRFIGDGMASLVQRIFPPEQRPQDGSETDAVLEEYRAAYGRHWQDTTKPFPGIVELLNNLTQRGIPIGILSNKSHDFTLKCVDAFLGDWQWDIVLGARDGIPKKPDPLGAIEAAEKMAIKPEQCYFIGDSDVDILTARNAKMQAIGVEWGFRSVEELKASGAHAVLATPEELMSIMELD